MILSGVENPRTMYFHEVVQVGTAHSIDGCINKMFIDELVQVE